MYYFKDNCLDTQLPLPDIFHVISDVEIYNGLVFSLFHSRGQARVVTKVNLVVTQCYLTQYNRIYCFSSINAVIPKDPLLKLLSDHNFSR